jgi:hypothetical protein
MNAQTLQAMPELFITSNHNRLKSYDKKSKLPKVYLPGNTHFEFEFFNPLQERIGMKIYINGNCINSQQLIIINPGQHGFLERYLDTDSRKFLFDTYMINGGNEAAKKAIEKNGLIKVEFFKEQQQLSLNNGWYSIGGSFGGPDYTYYNNTGNPVYGDIFTTHDGAGDFTCSATLDMMQNISEVKGSYSPRKSPATRKLSKKVSKNVETGRVEKGEVSNQTFETTTFNAMYSSFHDVEVQLLPESTKQVNVGTQTSVYCPNCRYRIRDAKKWNFCPKCGTDIQNI